jgi:hypothetical protein
MHTSIAATRRLQTLAAVTALALGAAAAPAAAATKPSNDILLKQLKKVDAELQSAVKSVNRTASGLSANLKTLAGGVAQAKSAAAAAQAGLAQTDATLAQTNVGLGVTNVTVAALSSTVTAASAAIAAASPRFAEVGVAGNQFAVSTTTSAAHPVSIVSQTSGAVILDFGEDVSHRALEVTPVAVGAASLGQAASCARVPVSCLGDTNPDHVIVTTEVVGGGGPTAADEPFDVVALAG